MTENWTYEFAFPVHGATPERVFRALTDRDELRTWFAEHARVDPGVGGRFEFWGRYTVGTPGEGEAGGTITSFEPDSRLGFEWELFGVPSRVTIALEPEETDQGSTTKVSIEHAFDGVLDMPRPKEAVDDWWRFNLGNLATHLSGGDLMRVDFSDPSPEIRLSMQMEAPPSTIWRALTEPEQLNRWMAKDARVELEVGGAWDPGFAPEGYEGPRMEILELEPERKLMVKWPDWRGDTSVPVQSVSWLLEPEGAGTRVTLIHSGFVRAVDLSDYPFGWSHFLRRLQELVREM